MAFQFNKALFHVGNPLLAKPHHDLSVIQKFIRENPEWAVIIVVDKKEEEEALKEKLKDIQLPQFHPGGFVVVWENDAAMIDCFCADLHFIQVWSIVGPAWYECKEGHTSAATLKEPLKECPTCKGELEFIQLDEKRGEALAGLLSKAVILMKFDTHSAKVLQELVSPTGNVMKNMPFALGLPQAPALRVESYIGAGNGKTAICISSGPSLKHSIPHLKRLQDQAIIISVARNFKLLRSNGIRVDYILSCEMFDWDYAIVADLTKEEVGETIMLFPPVCAPKTVETWPGKKMCVFDHPSATLLNRVPMTGGNSVSHHIYNFASEILKCDRVILVGQDLAYTEPTGETHAPGTVPEKWPDECKKEDASMQNESWDEAQTEEGPFYPSLHKADCWVEQGAVLPAGPTHVRTSPAYQCFRDLFDILISRVKVKTYNSCPNGLKIKNAKYVDLSAVTRLEEIP